MKATLQASFRLLKAISRGNAAVQGRLFDQLDFLLRVKGAEIEMAEAVMEVRILLSDFLAIILPKLRA